MSNGVNKVILIGRLGKDPEVRSMANGNAVVNFSMATSETWTDKGTNQKNEKTEWHSIVLFNRLAEVAGEYLSKGSNVYIEGKLQTRKWQDQSGNDRWSTEIIGGNLQMLDSNSSPKGEQKPSQRAPQEQEPTGDDFDDDIPF